MDGNIISFEKPDKKRTKFLLRSFLSKSTRLIYHHTFDVIFVVGVL